MDKSQAAEHGKTFLGNFAFGLFFGAGFVFGNSFGLYLLHLLHLSSTG